MVLHSRAKARFSSKHAADECLFKRAQAANCLACTCCAATPRCSVLARVAVFIAVVDAEDAIVQVLRA